MTVETFSNWCKRNEYVLWYKQEPLYLKNGEDYSTDTLIKKWQSELSAATPPDVEQMAEALHACFFLMMQPGWFDCLNGEKKFTVFAVETFVEARAHAEKLYYEATKGYQARQSAVQDATPQEGEMSSNEYHLRCAWDRTCEDRDNWKAEAKALSAIKKGLETSLTEALSSLSAAQEENKKLRQDLDLALQPRG